MGYIFDKNQKVAKGLGKLRERSRTANRRYFERVAQVGVVFREGLQFLARISRRNICCNIGVTIFHPVSVRKERPGPLIVPVPPSSHTGI